jgi:hypothetical protein
MRIKTRTGCFFLFVSGEVLFELFIGDTERPGEEDLSWLGELERHVSICRFSQSKKNEVALFGVIH